MSISTTISRRSVGAVGLVSFFLITFAITWGLIGSYISWPHAMAARFGAISGSHPFYFLATWAPAISAVLVVFACDGLDGLCGLFSRLLLWR